jgi:translation initiation factor 3 subunit I
MPVGGMRPRLLKGHERSITSIKYNRDGDLLFSTSKHPIFAVWNTENGERIGTYNGHLGAVWSVDVNRDSTEVLSGSADASAKLWDAEHGKEIHSWGHKAPVRSIEYSYGESQFLTVTDQVLGNIAAVSIWDSHISSKYKNPVIEIVGRNEAKIFQASWGELNRTIYTANEDGTIRVYDVRKGEQIEVIQQFSKAVMQISWDKYRSMFVAASKDGNAKLFDASTFQPLKTYHVGRPINCVSISPIRDEVILGGGQSADTVTTTRVDSSQFRIRFFHSIFEEELGTLPGHFGPVNALSYSPDGKGFASGGEDGYVRLHHFESYYFDHLVPSDDL